MITATRYHDISCGHRVAGHESKCAHLHGHNYRVTFTCAGGPVTLDRLGRVIDFSVMKSKLCLWLEDHWDHKFLAWEQDPMILAIMNMLGEAEASEAVDGISAVHAEMLASIVWVPFNPTAENMADYLLHIIGPIQLIDTGVKLIKVVIEETRKCSAEAAL